MRYRVHIALVLCLGHSICKAQTDPLAEMQRAIADQLPQVAVVKGRNLLTSEKLPQSIAARAKLLLAEAHVRAATPLDAVAVLDGETSQEAVFWRAAALQAAGRFSEALRWWRVWTPATDSPLLLTGKFNTVAALAALDKHGEALAASHQLRADYTLTDQQKAKLTLWEAELLLKLGRAQEAGGLLGSPVAGVEKSAWSYLSGKALLAQKDYDAAASAFKLASNEVNTGLKAPASLGLAKALRLGGRATEAGAVMIAFLSEHSESLWAVPALEELLACNDPEVPELTDQLVKWSNSGNTSLASKAAYASIQRRSKKAPKEVLSEIALFVTRYPTSTFIPQLQLQRVGVLVEDGRLPEAQASLDALKPETFPIQLAGFRREMAAYLSFAQDDYSAAAEAFSKLAASAEGAEERLRASFNSALAIMKNGGGTEAQISFVDGMPPELTAEWSGSLLLEKGLQAAADDNAEAAVPLLSQFRQKHPKHPRLFDGLLALAELQPQQPIWLTELKAIAATNEQKKATWQLELEIQATGPIEAYLKNCNDYLLAYPDASDTPQVWFRSAETCFNKQQLIEAEIRFTKAADVALPESVLAAAAHYWAGKAALASMTPGKDEVAIKHWEEAAKTPNPFRHKAKMAHAQLNQRRNQPDLALLTLKSILDDNTPPPEAETRYAVQCQRAELLASLPNATAEQLSEALKHCESVSVAPGASISWRQEASFRRAAILELQKLPMEALEAYYATMSPPITPQPILEVSDYHWFLRAGEKALAILEARQDWKGAVAISHKMGQAPGPLGDAARAKAERLKTQHLIWDDEAP